MPDPIVVEFEKYAALVANAGFSATVPDDEREYSQQAIHVHCEKMRQLVSRKPAFFAHHDYQWALNPENYSAGLEALFQFSVLLIISEIQPDHPDFHKLGNICIRFVASRHVNTEAVVRGPNKYIVISIALIRVMQTWGVALKELSVLGASVADHKEVICTENYLFGRQVEAALRHRWQESTPYLDYLIDTCMSYQAAEVPPRSFQLFREKSGDLESRIAMFLIIGEMFFICHELAHLLRHDETPALRSDREELDADHWAASLFIIFQAEFVGSSGSQDPVLHSAVVCGPGIFFSVMHCLLAVELAVAPLSAAPEEEKNRVIKELIREFKRNRLRMQGFRSALRSFGLDLIALFSRAAATEPVPGLAPISYENALQQLDVLSVGCRMRIAERVGLNLEISLEKNLFRGFG